VSGEVWDEYGARWGEVIETASGSLIVHKAESCKLFDFACCVHNPSDHPLATAQLNWRSDRDLMERICSHGIGHPDPDDIAFRRWVLAKPAEWVSAQAVHGCDGCCRGAR